MDFGVEQEDQVIIYRQLSNHHNTRIFVRVMSV